MKKALLILAGAVFFASSTAHAEGEMELPLFDTKNYCKQVGAMAGGSAQIELGCRKNEQNAINNLLQTGVYPEVLTYCSDVAKTVGGSYSILYGCVQNEMNARRALDAQ